ncbi:uncharacterized protein LOC120408123 [Mauremys reevesii]|uniref:uncharacterized protein LOC120408123 n=1 Tax=Mauremys reevesii TaxID=260615 RepID=UPI00193EEF5E|nr:uncharacterized protein LOC120408123 [Mauremys reevesii]
MEHLSEKAAERLHAEIINEADTPRTRDLKLLRAKRLAYYGRCGRTKIYSCGTDDKPSSSASRGAVLHSAVSTKEEENQTSTLNGSQQPNNATNGRKLLIQRSSGVNHQGKEQETVITNPETHSKYMSQTCISELDHRLLEDLTVPETHKLQHVMSWAQLVLSKSQQAAHLLKCSQLSQGLILPQGNESEIALSRETKETRSSSSSLSSLTDDFNLNAHANICKSSSFSSISEVNSEHTERCISLDPLRDKTLAPENKYFYNIQANNNNNQRKTIISIKRERRNPEISPCIFGQLALADETWNSKEKSNFQNISEKDMWSEMHSVQPQPPVVCKTDNSSKTAEAPREDPSTYFWAPLADSSDEECTDRIVTTKRSNRSGAEIKEHKKSSHSIFSLKEKNIKYLSSGVLGGSIASMRKMHSNGKWSVGEKLILDNKENYKHKDFNLALKAHGCSEGKVIADSIKEEAENRCIPFSSESDVENDELEDLVVDFTPLKREKDHRNESRFKDMEDSHSSEARKWIREEQTDSIFSSTSFDNSMGKGNNYKRAQKEIELKCSKIDPAMQSSNPLLNSLVNRPEHTFKVCPDCESLSYPDMTWCSGCGCVLLGVLTQSSKDNMEHKSKVFLGDVTDKQNNVFSQVIKSSQISESSSEEFPKLRERSDDCQKICWDDKPLLYSDCDISVLDKYYFYLDQLNKARCLHPKERNQPFSFQEYLGYSKEEKIAKHLEGKVVEQEETEETHSDCGATKLSYVNDINPDAIEQENSHLEEQDTSEGESTFMKLLDDLELNSKTEQKKSKVSIDRKLSETKSIRTQLTGSKRYWEKSSIAWSSYTHGELKPRSQCVQRPVSADVGKKMVYKAQNIQPSGTDSKQPCKSTFQGFEETVNWDNNCENDLSVWLLLPDELWLCIFSLFSHKELSQVAQVCHRFHQLARDESFWRQIQILDCHCLNDEWLIHLGLHHPQCFTLYHCHDETQSITHKGLMKFFQHCRDSLKELKITSCSGPRLRGDTILLHASSFCSQLTSVDISWTGATDLGVIALAEASLSLQALSANGCQLTDDAINALIEKHGKSLSKLEIFGCHALTNKCLGFMARECPNLQTLNIGRVPKVTDVCLAKIVNCLKKLTTLNITGLNVVRDRVVHFIVTQCPKLECLVLSSCSQVTDISLVEISTYLQTIRYLDVSGCKRVTDVGIQALAGSCRQLHYLDLSSTGTSKRGVCLLASFCHISLECVKLSFCKDITLEAVKKLCKNCKRLKLLHLYGCHITDLESIKEINKTVQVYHDLCFPPANI